MRIVARDPLTIRVDANRFQSRGPGCSLRDWEVDLTEVEYYNTWFEDVLSVWQDPEDGQFYVVDGHKRLELALRTGEPEVSTQTLGCETAAEALLTGALINIARFVNFPYQRLCAICSRLDRMEAALASGDIPPSSRVWQTLIQTVPELTQRVKHHVG